MVEQWQILPTLQTGENCGSGEPGGYSWLALLIVVSTAKSFPQKLLALIVKRLLGAVGQWVFSGKGYFGSKVRQFVNR